MTDKLTLSIYKEICRCYTEQMQLNLADNKQIFADKEDLLKFERSILKSPYIYSNEVKQISIDSFSCKFIDAFEIKNRYDKLLMPKERYFYFKNGPVAIQPAVTVVEPAKPVEPVKTKRAYTKRLNVPVVTLPKISVIKQILIYLKAA